MGIKSPLPINFLGNRDIISGSMNGKTETAKLLLNSGANPNAPSYNFTTITLLWQANGCAAPFQIPEQNFSKWLAIIFYYEKA